MKLSLLCICLSLILLLCSCTAADTSSGDPTTTAATTTTTVGTTAALSDGQRWDAVADFSAKPNGVWQYVGAEQNGNDPEWRLLPLYREDAGTGLNCWYVGSRIEASIGISAALPDYLQLHASGILGRMSGLQFVAPADGEYVLTGVVHDEWKENTGPLVLSNGTTDLLSVPLDTDTPFEISATLKKGETVTAYIRAAEPGDVIAVYLQMTATYKKVV